ncbi:MAG: AIR synthase-related protein, partial [Rhodoferax sp.]
YQAQIACTTQLNTPGRLLAELPGVHALTDVTGFGLLGHLLELCRGAGLGATLTKEAIPLLPGVERMAAAGLVTGASGRNWAGYGRDVDLSAAVTPVQKALLTDPQTSGGLLVACAPEAVDEVLAIFRKEGFGHAVVIGETVAGAARVAVA